jgi:hypothetical protein
MIVKGPRRGVTGEHFQPHSPQPALAGVGHKTFHQPPAESLPTVPWHNTKSTTPALCTSNHEQCYACRSTGSIHRHEGSRQVYPFRSNHRREPRLIEIGWLRVALEPFDERTPKQLRRRIRRRHDPNPR